MRKNFGVKPATYPQPVFILAAYDETGIPNAMNAAWGGISEDNELTICVSAHHKTLKNILTTGAFTVSMGTVGTMKECDYLGLVSGNSVPDKLSRCGFHTTKAAFVNAPLIDELPMAVECKLVSYDEERCRLIGEIVNVSADESILNDKGLVDPAKLQPITFDPMNHTYIALGDIVGQAFHDGGVLK